MGTKPKRKPRIAILTGGGDVPGLNPCIKTLVWRADSEGIEVMPLMVPIRTSTVFRN